MTSSAVYLHICYTELVVLKGGSHLFIQHFPRPKMPVAKIATNPHFGIFTIEKLVRAVPTLAVWGAAAGSAAMLFGSNVPLIQKDILSKIPVLGANWPVAEANDEE